MLKPKTSLAERPRVVPRPLVARAEIIGAPGAAALAATRVLAARDDDFVTDFFVGIFTDFFEDFFEVFFKTFFADFFAMDVLTLEDTTFSLFEPHGKPALQIAALRKLGPLRVIGAL